MPHLFCHGGAEGSKYTIRAGQNGRAARRVRCAPALKRRFATTSPHNRNYASPFEWTRGTDSIIAAIKRARRNASS